MQVRKHTLSVIPAFPDSIACGKRLSVQDANRATPQVCEHGDFTPAVINGNKVSRTTISRPRFTRNVLCKRVDCHRYPPGRWCEDRTPPAVEVLVAPSVGAVKRSTRVHHEVIGEPERRHCNVIVLVWLRAAPQNHPLTVKREPQTGTRLIDLEGGRHRLSRWDEPPSDEFSARP
jgi:hypothetical protein